MIDGGRSGDFKIADMLLGVVGGDFGIRVNLVEGHPFVRVLSGQTTEGGLIKIGDGAIGADEDEHHGFGVLIGPRREFNLPDDLQDFSLPWLCG